MLGRLPTPESCPSPPRRILRGTFELLSKTPAVGFQAGALIPNLLPALALHFILRQDLTKLSRQFGLELAVYQAGFEFWILLHQPLKLLGLL